jgi:hypothetical protein
MPEFAFPRGCRGLTDFDTPIVDVVVRMLTIGPV